MSASRVSQGWRRGAACLEGAARAGHALARLHVVARGAEADTDGNVVRPPAREHAGLGGHRPEHQGEHRQGVGDTRHVCCGSVRVRVRVSRGVRER